MEYALDIVLLCIFLLFVAVGLRRGFVRSASHFLGAIIAACAASLLGGMVAQWAFDTFFREALVAKIGESIGELGTANAVIAVESILSSVPDFLRRVLEDAGASASNLAGVIASGSGQVAETMADTISPVFVSLLKVLAVIVLFLLFMIGVRVLSNVIATAFRLPILSQVNGLLGGVFGFLLALVCIWITVSAVQVFLPMFSADAQIQVKEALDNSFIAGAIVNINPLGAMFK